MEIVILGGGIAGLSLAHFLHDKSFILEKGELGGLCRSFSLNGIYYDIGPHIIFSKNKEILDKHTSMIETNRIRRVNNIFFKDRFIKYPFENGLYGLSEEDREYCLAAFLKNPYENYIPKTMLQFFLTTFGEGITKLYLQPYNEKIWKFDSTFMDTQMVERIPKPPKEDVIKSATGEKDTDGYLHQLYFHYPKKHGIKTLIDAYADLIKEKSEVHKNINITELIQTKRGWNIISDKGDFETDQLINTIPIHELFKYLNAPREIINTLNSLLYNSIHIVVLQYKHVTIDEHFAIYVPQKEIIFHRVTNLNFLGDEYSLKNGGTTLMAEITFRPKSSLSTISPDNILNRVKTEIEDIGFALQKDYIDGEVRTFKYAYPIYDINHRKNIDKILEYLKSINIQSCGRFAEFEYLNTDGVVDHSQKLAATINMK